MTDIWIVTRVDYYDFEVIGVYDTEEKAEAIKAECYDRDLKRNETMYKKKLEKWPNPFHVDHRTVNQEITDKFWWE